MHVNEYGSADAPLLVLLAPMMVSGSDLYELLPPRFRGDYHIIAPDQGGHGKAGGYISADEEYRELKSWFLERGYQKAALVYGASLGVILIAAGVALWIYAVPVSKIDDGIRENRLVTTGAYALVRNPIYSAVMIACTGVLLIVGNAWFFVLALIYWLFMTVLMKATEEKWLRDLYGKEYDDYYKRVNRCWPWLPNGVAEEAQHDRGSQSLKSLPPAILLKADLK